MTPNVLTETSNLLKQSKDKQSEQLLETLKNLIEESEEIFVPSKKAAKNSSFKKLGFTDVVLLDSISPSSPLITVDHELYQMALKKDKDSAFNFRYYQFTH